MNSEQFQGLWSDIKLMQQPVIFSYNRCPIGKKKGEYYDRIMAFEDQLTILKSGYERTSLGSDSSGSINK